MRTGKIVKNLKVNENWKLICQHFPKNKHYKIAIIDFCFLYITKSLFLNFFNNKFTLKKLFRNKCFWPWESLKKNNNLNISSNPGPGQ